MKNPLKHRALLLDSVDDGKARPAVDVDINSTMTRVYRLNIVGSRINFYLFPVS